MYNSNPVPSNKKEDSPLWEIYTNLGLNMVEVRSAVIPYMVELVKRVNQNPSGVNLCAYSNNAST